MKNRTDKQETTKTETGKIIAKPMADGGYELLQYYGCNLGWILQGRVPPGENVDEYIKNLMRPVISITPDCIREGQIKNCGFSPLPTTPKQEIRPPPQTSYAKESKESKGGVNSKPTIPPPEPPKGQGGTKIIDDFSNWPKNESWPKNEMILRRLLFMEHHCDGKYSDDGEMQCGKCLIDFCRDSAEEIERKTKTRNSNRMQDFIEKHQDGYFPLGELSGIVGGPVKCDGSGKHPIFRGV